jgi:hypothetical protein
MNTTAQIRLPRPAVETEQRTEPRRSARASERPTFGEMLAEVVPVIGVVPVAGPPAVFVLGPWLFLVLMLAGPFAFLVALVVVMLVAAAVLAALAAAGWYGARRRTRTATESLAVPDQATDEPSRQQAGSPNLAKGSSR